MQLVLTYVQFYECSFALSFTHENCSASWPFYRFLCHCKNTETLLNVFNANSLQVLHGGFFYMLKKHCQAENILQKLAYIENSIREASTPQPGEIIFNTMTYRSSETVYLRHKYFQRSVTYIKVQIMFK